MRKKEKTMNTVRLPRRALIAFLIVLLVILACETPTPAPESTTINLDEIELPDGFMFEDTAVLQIPKDAPIIMVGSGLALAAPEPTFITKLIGVTGLTYSVWMFADTNSELIDEAVANLASGTYQVFESASEWVASLQSLSTQAATDTIPGFSASPAENAETGKSASIGAGVIVG